MNKLIERIKNIKIPGDIIVIPMFIGVTIASLFLQALQIGGFTTAIIEGAGTLVSVFLLFIGASLSLKNASRALLRGGVIIAVKIVVSDIIGLSVQSL